MSDPYSSAYKSVFDAIKNSGDVQAFVEPANIFGYIQEDPDGDAEPVLDYYESGDLPRLDIRPSVDEETNIYASSSTATLRFTVVVKMMLDTEAVNYQFFPLRWAITKALFKQGVTLGNDFISAWNVGPFDPVVPEEAANHDRGWEAEAVIRLRLCVDHQTIKQ